MGGADPAVTPRLELFSPIFSTTYRKSTPYQGKLIV
jgi:hypothetical protein